jgi:hypothetical protein
MAARRLSKQTQDEIADKLGEDCKGLLGVLLNCPGRKPVFLVFKRPAHPYKRPIQNGF